MKRFVILFMLFIVGFSMSAVADDGRKVISERAARYAETSREKKCKDSFYFNNQKLPGRPEEWVWIRNGNEKRPFQKAKNPEEARKKEEAMVPKQAGNHRPLPYGIQLSWKHWQDPNTRAVHTEFFITSPAGICASSILPNGEKIKACNMR